MKRNRGGFRPGIKIKSITDKYNKKFFDEIKRSSEIAFKKLAYENYVLIYGDIEAMNKLEQVLEVECIYHANNKKMGLPVKFVKKDENLKRFISDICEIRHYEYSDDENIQELFGLILDYDKITEFIGIDEIYIHYGIDYHDEFSRLKLIREFIEKFFPSFEKIVKWDNEVVTEGRKEIQQETVNTAIIMSMLSLQKEKEEKEEKENRN